MGPLEGSASQIASSMRGNAHPNCIDSGVISLYVVLLTLGVPLSCCDDRFRMRCGLRCAWGTAMMQESLRLSPNIRTASASGRRILKPSCTLCCISPWMNPTISRVHAYTWGPFFISFSKASIDQGGPVLTGIPSSA